ncbi:protein c-Fos-like [Littorina saxatilis]|uniref:BZIP domain-containing protein n=1 Tax=Littorina saxatilis TaxID=31220 RepID=A0AAN9G0J3_9CAEN
MTMRPTRGATGKVQRVGASTPRGALQQRSDIEIVVVKQEAPDTLDSSSLVPTVNSRDLLRNKIRAKRKAQGLQDIPVCFGESVQHELTPEEEEKKERRREQNRRAARRCRQKKKINASMTVQGFAQMIQDNENMENEIVTLRKQKKALERVLSEHTKSGCCKAMNAAMSPVSVVPASPADMESLPSPAVMESSTAEMESSPAVNPENTLPPVLLGTSFFGAYLEGPIAPGETFEDLSLESSQDISHLLNLPEMCSNQLTSSVCIADPRESLKNLMPASPNTNTHTLALLSPISPVAANQNRCSVSSTTSDWSEQSQGFLVPHGFSPESAMGRNDSFVTNASTMGSSSDADPMDSGCSPQGVLQWNQGQYSYVQYDAEEDEEDDDVFVVTSVDGKIFQQYNRRQ